MAWSIEKRIIAMLLLCGGLQACGHTGTEGRYPIAGGLQSEMREIRLLMEQEVGDASAQSLEQCRVLPVGAKACGGPQTFVIYSTVDSDERKLQELARQYAEAEEKFNRVAHVMSTCSYVIPPEVRIQNGKCKSKQR
ncbi:hypothetical protein [Noviherbaspirillum sp. Root189]|uniref:hypothetical protein n=1 Tax=Noviherbaspirillum sp. Root189 TaxID=1736487 RepID=UPI00070FE7A5|nr:hypothetical protein [Noviherbaspirillum sp. Root189]KRB86962.1 hypothetical protein ASE07_20350 [Noviherbaspirillum sp. Root189]